MSSNEHPTVKGEPLVPSEPPVAPSGASWNPTADRMDGRDPRKQGATAVGRSPVRHWADWLAGNPGDPDVRSTPESPAKSRSD